MNIELKAIILREGRIDETSKEFLALIKSIQIKGVLKPITVRKIPGSNTYILVDGLRRCYAVRNLGFDRIDYNIQPTSENAALKQRVEFLEKLLTDNNILFKR